MTTALSTAISASFNTLLPCLLPLPCMCLHRDTNRKHTAKHTKMTAVEIPARAPADRAETECSAETRMMYRGITEY